MKTPSKVIFMTLVLISFFEIALLPLHAQGTAFTYQGRLDDSGSPVHGVYDLRFKLYGDPLGNNQVGSTFLTNGIPISNGLFMVTLDFGAGVFNGSNYWLGTDVRTNGGSSYADLSPFQPLTPTPYAIFANTASNVSGVVGSGQISGTYGNPLTLNNPGNNFNGSFSGNGTNLTNVNAVTLGGVGAAGFWKTAGNSGTTTGANYVGTSDNQPLEMHVNGQRVLRLELSAPDSPNIIGGYSNNFVAAGISGSTIAGGGLTGQTNQILGSGYTSFIGGGRNNLVSNFNCVIGGGANNMALENANVIAGGSENFTSADHAVIGGGKNNTNLAYYTFTGGGFGNLNSATYSVIDGGLGNFNNGQESVIAGGENNTIGGGADHSVIGGGDGNVLIGSDPYPVYGVIGGGESNMLETNTVFCVINGGIGNDIQSNTFYSAIGGGTNNVIQSNNVGATIAGGVQNIILASIYGTHYVTIGGGINNTNGGYASTIAGGSQNNASGDSSFEAAIGGGANNISTNSQSTVAGGIQNLAGGLRSTVGGGENNSATGAYSTIPGGAANIASGSYSFAAGFAAFAYNNSAFVWCDSSGGPLSSSVDNSVTMRAAGGYRLFSNAGGTSGVSLAANGAAWTSISDRNVKKDFAPVNGEAVLDKLAQVPVEQWHYKWENSGDTLNIGPMAQDFKGAFYPGRDDKSISTLEFDGVELAAIQGLNQKVQKLNDELKKRDAENVDLKLRLDALEKIVSKLDSNAK